MANRITSNMTTRTFLANLNRSNARLNRLQEQLSTNKRINRPSDDPTGAISVMSARSRLLRISQYRDTLSTASTWLRQGETSVMDINSAIKSAYESAVDAATDTKGPDDRKATAFYIEELIQTVIEAGNSTIGSQFIFGGVNSSSKPFEEQWSIPNPAFDAAYVPSEADPIVDQNGQVNIKALKYIGHEVEMVGGQWQYKLDDAGNAIPLSGDTPAAKQRLFYNGIALNDNHALNLAGELDQATQLNVSFGKLTMDITKNGTQVFGTGDQNVYQVLRDLHTTLMDSNSGAQDVSAHLDNLQTAQSHLLTLAAEYGGKTNRIDIMDSRFSLDEINYTQRISDVEDIDLAEVIMNLKMAESVYRAALDAGARIIQPSLLDYMR